MELLERRSTSKHAARVSERTFFVSCAFEFPPRELRRLTKHFASRRYSCGLQRQDRCVWLLFRLCVRIHYYRKLYVDDLLLIAAWIMLLASSVLWQIRAPMIYEQFIIMGGEKPPGPGFVAQQQTFLRNHLALSILFSSCLWTVKLSVLVFFRRLESKMRGHQIWWWCVLVITIATWIVCIADVQYQCLLGSGHHIRSQLPTSISLHV